MNVDKPQQHHRHLHHHHHHHHQSPPPLPLPPPSTSSPVNVQWRTSGSSSSSSSFQIQPPKRFKPDPDSDGLPPPPDQSDQPPHDGSLGGCGDNRSLDDATSIENDDDSELLLSPLSPLLPQPHQQQQQQPQQQQQHQQHPVTSMTNTTPVQNKRKSVDGVGGLLIPVNKLSTSGGASFRLGLSHSETGENVIECESGGQTSGAMAPPPPLEALVIETVTENIHSCLKYTQVQQRFASVFYYTN